MSESGTVIHRTGIELESRSAEVTTHGEATATTVRVRWSAALPALLVGVLATRRGEVAIRGVDLPGC